MTTVRLIYRGPGATFFDPTTGLRWQRGAAQDVPGEAAQRLRDGPGVWEMDVWAPQPPTAPEGLPGPLTPEDDSTPDVTEPAASGQEEEGS